MKDLNSVVFLKNAFATSKLHQNLSIAVTNSDVKKGFLSGELLVGRNPDCDIVISDSQTSGKHCRFVFENGNMLVEDLKSTNGTTLNGMTFVGKTKVNSGDMIMFGNKEYRITF